MEAVAPHAVGEVVLIGQGVHIGLAGHGLVEGGVKHGDHGHVAHNGLAGLDAGDVGGVVQRREGDALLDGLHHIVGDADGGGELLPAVDDPVTHRVDLLHGVDHAVLGAGQLVDDGGNGLGVGGHGHVLVEDLLALHQRGVLQVAVDADALAETLGQHGLGLHINELILQGRAACVDDENFHKSFPFTCKLWGNSIEYTQRLF